MNKDNDNDLPAMKGHDLSSTVRAIENKKMGFWAIHEERTNGNSHRRKANGNSRRRKKT